MTKILIVEDEENIARFVELELGYEGYETAEPVGKRADAGGVQHGDRL